jgi:hypothetical protein
MPGQSHLPAHGFDRAPLSDRRTRRNHRHEGQAEETGEEGL